MAGRWTMDHSGRWQGSVRLWSSRVVLAVVTASPEAWGRKVFPVSSCSAPVAVWARGNTLSCREEGSSHVALSVVFPSCASVWSKALSSAPGRRVAHSAPGLAVVPEKLAQKQLSPRGPVAARCTRPRTPRQSVALALAPFGVTRLTVYRQLQFQLVGR